MAHSLKNQKSQQILSEKLKAALETARVFGGALMVWGSEFDDFRGEAIKSVSKWMSVDDINTLAYQAYIDVSQNSIHNSGTLPPNLPTSLDRNLIDELTKKIVEELASIPRKYEIFFPLPILPPIEMNFGPDISITADPHSAIISLSPTHSAIKVRAQGFAHSAREQSAMRHAISRTKVLLAIGYLYNLFDRRNILNLSSFTGLLPGLKSETLLSASIDGPKNGTHLPHKVSLGLGFSKILQETALKSEIDSTNFIVTSSNVVHLVELMYEATAEENIRSIRRALEWYFDALIDDDTTTGFIKTCIGLEAAVSEQNDGVGITEQLADRTAFLLRKTPNSREETRKTMRDIYKLRSKIVHGNISGLSHAELESASTASFMLESILKVEINAVSQWWQKLS